MVQSMGELFGDQQLDERITEIKKIVDRMGFDTFKKEVLEGIKLNPEAEIVELHNPGYSYRRRA